MEQTRYSASGIPLYSYENAASHGFCLSLIVRAGALYETEKNCGITHFLEHVAIRNVQYRMRGELYAMLDRAGLELNAATYTDMIHFYVSGAKEHFALGARVLCALLEPIVLPRTGVDAERRRIKAEIREGDEKNTIGVFTASLLCPDTPLRFPIVGTLAAVNSVSVRALEEHRKRLFSTGNFFFYATGHVTPADLDVLLAAVDAAPPPSPAVAPPRAVPPAAFGKRGAAVFVKNADYTLVRFTFDLDLRGVTLAECDLLYDVLLSGYDSRFFIELSEKRGLIYDLSGSVDRYGDFGFFQFTFEVRSANLSDAVSLAVGILREMKGAPVQKVMDMKAAYIDNAALLLDDARDLGFTFACDVHILGAPYRSLSDRKEAYRAVTPERICELSRRFFTAQNLTLTIKGDKKRISPSHLQPILQTLDS